MVQGDNQLVLLLISFVPAFALGYFLATRPHPRWPLIFIVNAAGAGGYLLIRHEGPIDWLLAVLYVVMIAAVVTAVTVNLADQNRWVAKQSRRVQQSSGVQRAQAQRELMKRMMFPPLKYLVVPGAITVVGIAAFYLLFRR